MLQATRPSLVPALRRYRAATDAAIAGFAYFAVWTAVGLAVYPLDVALSSIEMRVPVVAGIVMVIAGAWQFTAWKARRLACCHAAHDARQAAPSTPWRDGLRLGIHCVACCGNLMAGLRSIVGGEITEYTQLLEEARRHAVDRMVKNANLMGGNAVVMMRFDSSEMGQTMSEIVAYGTAVVVELLPA